VVNGVWAPLETARNNVTSITRCLFNSTTQTIFFLSSNLPRKHYLEELMLWAGNYTARLSKQGQPTQNRNNKPKSGTRKPKTVFGPKRGRAIKSSPFLFSPPKQVQRPQYRDFLWVYC